MATTADAGRCMKCGFCTSNCPIYSVDHIESHVARGRNVLIKSAGENGTDEAYRERLSYCLLCGRCAAVCPAKVPSADITVAARAEMVARKDLNWPKRLAYRGVFNHRDFMAGLLGFASHLPGMSNADGKPLRHLPDLACALAGGLALPALSRPFLSKRLPERIAPKEGVKKQGTLAFFPGCAFEFFFADAGESTAQSLAQVGYEVVYPKGLTCCGLAVHSAGDIKTAKEMAGKNMKILSPFDQVVTGCATCNSALKDYGAWFADDDQWRDKAKAFSAKVSEATQLLVKAGFKTALPEKISVTYHDPCHSKWRLGIAEEPRQLLRSIEGVEFREMEGADDCCGLGGAFGIEHRDISLALQAKKMANIAKTGAEIVVTPCPGCLIQLRDGIRRHKLPVRALHTSQLVRGQIAPPRKPR